MQGSTWLYPRRKDFETIWIYARIIPIAFGLRFVRKVNVENITDLNDHAFVYREQLIKQAPIQLLVQVQIGCYVRRITLLIIFVFVVTLRFSVFEENSISYYCVNIQKCVKETKGFNHARKCRPSLIVIILHLQKKHFTV